MEYSSWPYLVDTDQRVLYTLFNGYLYRLAPHDDGEVDSRENYLTLYKGSDVVAHISVAEGKVVDFVVTSELIALATIKPAGVYICKPWRDTSVLYLRLPLDTPDKSLQRISNVTLGNYGGNIIVVWYGSGDSPVHIGMLSGKDAFRFDPMPLVFYDEFGRQKMYIKTEQEKVLAVPHVPRQYGMVASISPKGLKFYSLHPFYTLNKLSDDSYITHLPISPNYGWNDYSSNGLPDRLQFSGYDLLVNVSGNHITMKYDPFHTIKSTTKDWVKITVDGVELPSNQSIYLTPFDTDRSVSIKPSVDATDITIHADLPVSFKLANQIPPSTVNLSQTGIKYLPKNTQKTLTMRTIQCFTPWQLARFFEKFNIKIRAELWG